MHTQVTRMTEQSHVLAAKQQIRTITKRNNMMNLKSINRKTTPANTTHTTALAVNPTLQTKQTLTMLTIIIITPAATLQTMAAHIDINTEK
nr:hypothetical protein [uncultured Alloprevotella sp.]